MQRCHQQPVFAGFWDADVLFRFHLLFIHVWIGRATCLRTVLEQLALPCNSLRRIRRRFFGLFFVPSARLYSRSMQLLSYLCGNVISSSLRHVLAFSNDTPRDKKMKNQFVRSLRGRSRKHTTIAAQSPPVQVRVYFGAAC